MPRQESSMAADDVAVPIVFPDYRITVESPSAKVRLPFLGHAGILFFDGRSGETRYFEYGRYDRPHKGVVQERCEISDLIMDGTGRPTATSLKVTLGEISTQAGQRGRLVGAYIEVPTGGFPGMLRYSENRWNQNNQEDRAPYTLLGNSCLHFMKEVAEAGGAIMPPVFDPRPAGYIERVRAQFADLDFSQPKNLAIEGIALP